MAIVVFSIIVPSCLFVKAPEQKSDVQNVALSPQPEIEMSDELVRTRAGDMITLMPKGWVFLDTKGDASADIVAIAVNPEYTLSMVVSSIPAAESSREQIQAEGLLGLARVAYQKHVRKSAGTSKLVGTYRIAELGARRFGVYDFSTSGVHSEQDPPCAHLLLVTPTRCLLCRSLSAEKMCPTVQSKREFFAPFLQPCNTNNAAFGRYSRRSRISQYHN